MKYWSIRPYIREVTLQFPIDCLEPKLENANIRLMGGSKIWQIFKKLDRGANNHKTFFRLLSPVRLNVEYNGSITTHYQNIQFELKDIEWTKGEQPEEMANWETYGECVVHFHRETLVFLPGHSTRIFSP